MLFANLSDPQRKLPSNLIGCVARLFGITGARAVSICAFALSSIREPEEEINELRCDKSSGSTFRVSIAFRVFLVTTSSVKIGCVILINAEATSGGSLPVNVPVKIDFP